MKIARFLFSSSFLYCSMVAIIYAGDIVEEAQKAGHTEFVAALTAAELVNEAKTTTPPAPFTVFVPTNQAFATANLTKDRKVLRPIIKFHVVPGQKITKDALANQLETISGAKITITADKKVKGKSEEAAIVTSIECTNGIIHVIDKVLTPTA